MGGGQLGRDERIAAILRRKALDPTLTLRQLGREFGVSHETVRKDIAYARDRLLAESAATMRLVIVQQYFELLRAHMPMAVAGDHKSANVCIAANKEIASLLGLNAVTKQSVSVEIRKLIEALPPVPGLSVDDAVAEAERILAGIGGE